MSKVLNLDDLETSVAKQIVIDGKTYEMKPFTVESFIEQMKEVDELRKLKEDGAAAIESVKLVVRAIVRAFPGVEEARLMKMEVSHLEAIQAFIQSSAEEEVAAGNE